MESNGVWRDVVGYEDLFMVSVFGEVFSKRTNKILKQHTRKNRYKTIATKIGGRNGKSLCFKVHRLVAQAFIPNPENKPFVNHIDGCPGNNNVENLEWCTASENLKHAIETGLYDINNILDANKRKRKLDREQVLFIRENVKLPKSERLSLRALAKMFNIGRHTIEAIAYNTGYKDVY